MYLTRIASILFALVVFVLVGAPSHAAECKGMKKSSCDRSTSCSWVSGYKKQSGAEVKSYCRSKGGKADNSSKKKSTASNSEKKKSSSKSTKKKTDKSERTKSSSTKSSSKKESSSKSSSSSKKKNKETEKTDKSEKKKSS